MLFCIMDACIIDDICEEDATEPNMLLVALLEPCALPVLPFELLVFIELGAAFEATIEAAVLAEALRLRLRPLLIFRNRAASWRFTRLAQWSPGTGRD